MKKVFIGAQLYITYVGAIKYLEYKDNLLA